MKKSFILVVLSVSLFASCVDKDEYQANVTVINNSDTEVKNFVLMLIGDPARYGISVLGQGQQSELQIKWIGQQSAFGGSKDNSYPFLDIEYYIEDKKYDVSSEEGTHQDDAGNYYSEKTITNASKIIISIGNDGYEIRDSK
jgi:hypothetical protein